MVGFLRPLSVFVLVALAMIALALEAGGGLTCFGKPVPARYTGDGGSDHIVGNANDNVLWGGGGNDHLEGKGGNDRLCGGAGQDHLEGQGGHDKAEGNGGDDSGDEPFAGLYGGPGKDLLIGNAGSDGFDAGDGADILRGSGGDDYLFDDDGTGHDGLYGGPDGLQGDYCEGDAGDTKNGCEFQ